MIKRQYLYIFSLFIALSGAVMPAWCQEGAVSSDTIVVQEYVDTVAVAKQDSVSNTITSQTDSIPPKKLLSGVELRIDYGKLLLAWSEFETKYEVGINVRFFEQIVLATEFGGSELNPLKAYDNTLFYTIKGMYGRVGLDYYMEYDPSNFYYVGFRYAMSSFEDEGVFLLGSDYWPEYQDGFGSKDVTASWAELVLGTETFLKVGAKAKSSGKSRLILGWNARLRFITDFENRVEPPIYAIPGYGRTFNNVAAALNFYIKIRLGS